MANRQERTLGASLAARPFAAAAAAAIWQVLVPTFDVRVARALSAKDWEADSRGSHAMDYKKFTAAMLKTIDLWIDPLHVDKYEAFLYYVLDAMTTVELRPLLLVHKKKVRSVGDDSAVNRALQTESGRKMIIGREVEAFVHHALGDQRWLTGTVLKVPLAARTRTRAGRSAGPRGLSTRARVNGGVALASWG